jgi:3-(3-hydroxy-phenyl)propionate hydroxylase
MMEKNTNITDIAGKNQLPVVIAGAGPVGCCVALYLVQQGIPVVIIEAEDDLPMDMRASTFHPPTLDLLDQLGLTEKLIPQGLIVREFQFRERSTNTSARFNMAHIADYTAHPYRLQCEQYKLTRTVFKLLEDYPLAKTIKGMSVEGFRDHGTHVDVLTFDGEAEHIIHGSFLVGTDGSNSRIRKASATLFPGLTYPERFLTISTDYPFENDFDDLSWVNYVADPDEWCVMLKTPTLWRVQFPTPIEASPEELLSDDYIQDRLKRLNPAGSPYRIEHRTLYRVHQRVAENYRASFRTVLVGDAAHVNNPLGGMGMNGGVHDAFNLCDKFIQILKNGRDVDEQLNIYDAQRRKICIDFVQRQTIENKKLLEATDRSIQLARQDKFLDMASTPEKQREYLLRSSMINSLKESLEIKAA